MQTRRLSKSDIIEAVELLKAGQTVALPTETVYGLAANAHDTHAIQRVYTAKGRPEKHPLIVHISSIAQVHQYAQQVSEQAIRLAENFWPGPLTMILRKQEHVTDHITGGLQTIALRLPNHPIILEVMTQLGNGIVAPSANAYTKTSPTQAEHVLKTLDGKIAAIIDSGSTSVGIESTIIDMTKEVPTLLRPGAISTDMISDVLKTTIKSPVQHTEKVSGNMKNHYQPEKPLHLKTAHEIERLAKQESHIAVIHHSDINQKQPHLYYKMPTQKAAFAKLLYSTLHEIDKTGVHKILVETLPKNNQWVDVLDRLTKASTKSE